MLVSETKNPESQASGSRGPVSLVLSRLCTTSGPATQAGKGKPEVIKVGATHARIMARAKGQRKRFAPALLFRLFGLRSRLFFVFGERRQCLGQARHMLGANRHCDVRALEIAAYRLKATT